LVNPHPDDWYDVGKDEYCGSVTKNYTIQMSFNNLSRTQTATADLFPNTSIVDEMWAKMPTGWVTPAAIINVRATARDSFGAGGSGGKAFYWLHNLNSSYNPQMANVQIENSASPGMKVVAESVDDLRNLSVKYDVLDPDGNLRNIHIVVMGDPVAGGVCGCTIPASSLGLSQTSTSWQTNKRLYPFSASFTDTNALFNKINRSYYGSGKSCTIELNVAASDVDQNISEPGADQFYVNDKASFNLKVRGEGDDTYGLSVGDQLVPTPVSGNGIQSISLILPKFPDPNEPNVRLLRVTDTSSGVDTSVDDIGLWLESKARFSLGNTYRYLPASGTGGAAWSDQLDVSQCP